jgi:hypothetical protein
MSDLLNEFFFIIMSNNKLFPFKIWELISIHFSEDLLFSRKEIP